MMLRKWDRLPPEMQTAEVRKYYDILSKKRCGLFFKRVFDIFASGIGLTLLSPVLLILAVIIACDSKGGVFFRQERVTQYGRVFHIHKFRTMVANAESIGSHITVKNDMRITKVGAGLRRLRLDELPQLIDIFVGNMTFVGTRPEVLKYVRQYTDEMKATLLLPAGVTSDASIRYKDEDRLLENAGDVDRVYVEKILPGKMFYNLRQIENFSLWNELKTMFMTVFAVLGKEYADENMSSDAKKEM